MQKTLSLPEFINSHGVRQLSRDINIDHVTVHYWKHLKSAPRPETALKLIKFSKGKLNWESVYAPYAKSRTK